ncbi:hypothetical protein PsYK624_053130 [Phanerochaete sordida]|uniref:Heterokaryon incompatibility domain-containing protein n=1 Tax=Phanerochaete sordida TaxID=48140 RepID=A0A9P3LCI1_9APHY|nr:hypothetical protein PsYK624_053130 [Phanerochaete sordida]
MSDSKLLHLLNAVLDTHHQLRAYSTAGLLKCIRDTSHDFGEAYGKVRNWWWGSHSQSLQRGYYAMMRKRQAKHDAFRRHVVQDFSLQRSTLPPRRVWDLYSNRVLPLVVLANSDTSSHDLPDRLWTVSHSWVPEADRDLVWTPINGRQWPVPVPRATTLEHVRVELLNMGAEYVWLDVLCLRQRGRAADEAQRTEEWKTDIPTIGHIYQGQPFRRPCITYFNGLGLPLDTSQPTLTSDRHWFSRVWTLQESLTTWLPGGLTGEALPDGDTFFAQLQAFPSLTLTSDDRLVRELMARHCTNELDRIAGLAYFLRCVSLPLYNAAMPVEHAWELLLKHASPAWRSSLLLRYPVDTPFAPYPSWKGYGASGPVLSATSVDSSLWLAEQSQLNTADPGRYYHFEATFGPYQILCSGGQPTSRRRFKLDFCKDNVPIFSVSPLRMHGVILQDALYWLVRVSGDSSAYWVATEVVAMHADEVTSDAVKWAVLEVSYRADDWVEEYIRCFRRKIIYLPGVEARLRTKYAEQYMAAYKQMTTDGKQFIIY